MTYPDVEERHLLPRLADPTPLQLFVAGVAIAIAVILLGAVAARIAQHVQLLQWWVPLVFIGGIAVADFASGVVHWGADTWGRADLPVIGPRLLVPFRVHHLNPDDFLRRRFLDTNGDVAAVTIPALVVLMVIPLDSAWAHVVAVGGFACCALGGMTNQIHQWAHMPSPPAVARALQKAGVLLRPGEHAGHHRGPYDTQVLHYDRMVQPPTGSPSILPAARERRHPSLGSRAAGRRTQSGRASSQAPPAGGAGCLIAPGSLSVEPTARAPPPRRGVERISRSRQPSPCLPAMDSSAVCCRPSSASPDSGWS